MSVEIILASASPRRKQLLETVLDVPFSIHLSHCEEVFAPNDPVWSVGQNALKKWHAVHARYPDACVIAADTLVFFDGQSLGKPKGLSDAKSMLTRFSGRHQLVFTAVAMNKPDDKQPELRIETASLRFKSYDLTTVKAYLNEVCPLDRAGAYDINEHGHWLIESWTGSYSVIMGLPRKTLRDWFSTWLPNVLKSKDADV